LEILSKNRNFAKLPIIFCCANVVRLTFHRVTLNGQNQEQATRPFSFVISLKSPALIVNCGCGRECSGRAGCKHRRKAEPRFVCKRRTNAHTHTHAPEPELVNLPRQNLFPSPPSYFSPRECVPAKSKYPAEGRREH
jgi:hypothetical protein